MEDGDRGLCSRCGNAMVFEAGEWWHDRADETYDPVLCRAAGPIPRPAVTEG